MRKLLSAAAFLVLAASPGLAADPPADLKKTDEAWSQAAAARSVDQFMSFIRDDAWAVGLDGKWVHGKDAVRDMWSKPLADATFKLSWSVDSAEVSKDGALGYTRGTFQGSQGDKAFSGSYATVWKKDKDGKWRVAVDIPAAATQP